MKILLLIVVIGIALVFIRKSGFTSEIDRLKQEGVYPADGEPITDEHIKELIRRDQKIAAIKLYRERNRSVGLTEAKQAVEKMAAELGR